MSVDTYVALLAVIVWIAAAVASGLLLLTGRNAKQRLDESRHRLKEADVGSDGFKSVDAFLHELGDLPAVSIADAVAEDDLWGHLPCGPEGNGPDVNAVG